MPPMRCYALRNDDQQYNNKLLFNTFKSSDLSDIFMVIGNAAEL